MIRGYGLGDRDYIPGTGKNPFSRHHVQTDSGAQRTP